jgi:glutaryl-CoA dehydrogenase
MKTLDYYAIDGLLTDEERDLRDAVRGWVEAECLPIIAGHYEKGTFPHHLIPRMADMGLFGLHVDGYGCQKASHMAYGLVCQELGRCDSGLRAMFSVQNSLCMYPIFAFGSEDQQQKWLPKMARGEVIGCFGLSEPDFGSNPGGMVTRAERRGLGYVLHGKKMWITNGSMAHVALIWAKLDGEIKGFLVETDRPGFDARPIERKLAYRTSPTALILLDGCEIPSENLLPGGAGLKAAFACLNLARFGVGCGALGSALASYQAAQSFALKREVFNRPIGAFQLVQEKLARMVIEITKAQLLAYHLSRLLDGGQGRHQQVSLFKMNNVHEAMKIARTARDILGARGILADHHVMRHLCDLEALSTLEGTQAIHTLVLGNDLTGFSAFE